jgi:cytoskeletal protein CcmA (bactofilin family)
MIFGQSKRFGNLLPLPSALCLMVFLSAASFASTFKKADNVQITNLDMIDDDLYVYAGRLTIDGIVSGDLTAFDYQTTINGEIGQSANLFCRNLQVAGKIDGSLRAFAEVITVNGFVTRSALLFGRDVSLSKGSVVEKDVNIFGGQVSLDGTIKGDAAVEAEIVEITGVITGNVKITARKIEVLPPAVITGNLTYTSENQAQIDTTSGVTISGQTTWNHPKEGTLSGVRGSGSGYTGFVVRISSLLAAFLFGIIIAYLFKPYIEEAVNQVRTRTTVSIAAGLLGVLILVIALVVLILAIVSLIAGFLLVAGDLAPIGSVVLIFSILMLPVTSFAGISGGILFYTGKIIVAFWIGFAIMRKAKPGTAVLSKSALFIGLAILTALFAIPVFGAIVYVAAAIVGAGGIMLGIKHCRRGFLAPAGPTESPTL